VDKALYAVICQAWIEWVSMHEVDDLVKAPANPCKHGARSGATAPGGAATAPAQWVSWRNRSRHHRANPDDMSPAAAEHRYHRNHTAAAAAAPATA